MFVRRIKNRANGKTYVQIVDKSSGKYRVLKNMGNSSVAAQIDVLVKKGQLWIQQKSGLQQIDFTDHKSKIESYLNGINQLQLIGLELLLGKMFDNIGFNKIGDPIFRHLIIYRLCYPRSKLKTTEYLYRYQQLDWSEDQVYRYLDKLYHSQKESVQQISYEHTLKILDSDISIVFYDVTTVYFEIDQQDELRKTGFSKDGKHQCPQIVLGLLVSKGGYPLAYDIFEGNKFEGHTMLPIIESFKEKYKLPKLVIIADSGLLSSANVEELMNKDYEFILGARIKSESQKIKDKILSLELSPGQSAIIKKGTLNLIVTYSDDRAKKDRYNREKGLRKLEKQIRTGRLTKSQINNRGYNKYLKMDGEIKLTIDKEKYLQDAQWDGLKGYLTNAQLSKDQVIENYRQLWHIEKAFRVAKSELKIRPVYHRLQRRIEAHICIAFVAYKVYKELERQLKEKQSDLSPEKAIEIAENIYELSIKVPDSNENIKRLLLLTEEQNYLAKLFCFGC